MVETPELLTLAWLYLRWGAPASLLAAPSRSCLRKGQDLRDHAEDEGSSWLFCPGKGFEEGLTSSAMVTERAGSSAAGSLGTSGVGSRAGPLFFLLLSSIRFITDCNLFLQFIWPKTRCVHRQKCGGARCFCLEAGTALGYKGVPGHWKDVKCWSHVCLQSWLRRYLTKVESFMVVSF